MLVTTRFLTSPGRPLEGWKAALRRRESLLGLGYAFGVYGFSALTVPLMLLFAGDMWLPKSVSHGPHGPVALSVVGDVLLIVLFGLQHSGMARPSVKRLIERRIPPALERSTYVLMASLSIWALCLGWQPVHGSVWRLHGDPRVVLDVGFWLGFVLVYVATLLLDHLHLLGFSQAVRHYVKREPDPTSDTLHLAGPYRWVRHPLMTGLLLCFWSAADMTAGRLLWAAGLSTYIVIGTVLEERDLIVRFGAAYHRYRHDVPAFLPRMIPRRIAVADAVVLPDVLDHALPQELQEGVRP